MFRLSSFITLLMCVLSCANIYCPCVQRESINITIVTHGGQSDAFWKYEQRAMMRSAQDMRVSVVYKTPTTVDVQRNRDLILESAIDHETGQRKLDGFITTVANFPILEPALDRIISNVIPTIIINAGDDTLKHFPDDTIFVGQREVDAAIKAAHLFLTTGHYPPIVLCLDHESGQNAGLVARCNTLRDILLGQSGNAYTLNVPKNNNAQATAMITNVLQNVLPNITGLFCGRPVYDATRAALAATGRLGNVTFGTVNYNSAQPVDFESGALTFAVDQQPYLQGYLPVMLLTLRAKTGMRAVFDSRVLQTGPGIINKFNYNTRLCTVTDVVFCTDPMDYQQSNLPLLVIGNVTQRCPCTDKRTHSIAVLWPRTNEIEVVFWTVLRNGMIQAAADMNISIVFIIPTTREGAKESVLQQWRQKRTTTMFTGVLTTASTFNRTLFKPSIIHSFYSIPLPISTNLVNPEVHIGANQSECGIAAANIIMEQINPGDNRPLQLWCVNSEFGNQNLASICRGFSSQVSRQCGAQCTLSTMIIDGGNPSAAQEQLEKSISSNLFAVLSTDSSSVIPTSRLLENRPLIHHVVIDADSLSISLLAEKKILAIIDQQPYLQGYLSVATLSQRLFHNSILANPHIWTGPLVISHSNTSDRTFENVACEVQNLGVTVCPKEKWSLVMQEQELSVEAQVTLQTLYAVTLVLLTATMIMVHWWRKHRIIYSTSMIFMQLVSLGLLLASISGWILLERVQTSFFCEVPIWFLNIAFHLVVSSMFLKTFRVYRIFNSEKLKVVRIKNAMLLKWLLLFITIDIIILTIWASVSTGDTVRFARAFWQVTTWGQQGQTTTRDISLSDIDALDKTQNALLPRFCIESRASDSTFVFLLWLTKVLIVIPTCYVIYAVRKTPLEEFNDTTTMVLCGFIITLLGAFGLVLNVVTMTVANVPTSTVQIAKATLIWFGVLSILLLVSGSKLWAIIRRRNVNVADHQTQVASLMSRNNNSTNDQKTIQKRPVNYVVNVSSPSAPESSNQELFANYERLVKEIEAIKAREAYLVEQRNIAQIRWIRAQEQTEYNKYVQGLQVSTSSP